MGRELCATSAPVLSGFVAVPWRDMGVCHEMLKSDVFGEGLCECGMVVPTEVDTTLVASVIDTGTGDS
jgi:hypothetical protein